MASKATFTQLLARECVTECSRRESLNYGEKYFNVLRYTPEGRIFDSRWCNWKFSLTSFRPHYVPGVDSTSNRNEYQEYFQWGKGGRC